MATYTLNGNTSAVNTVGLRGTVACWAVTATLKRIKWYEFVIGATAVPNATDCAIQIDISRLLSTTSLAGTAFTPNATDPADGAALTQALVNITTEPNSAIVGTTPLMNFGLNQRNTFRWIAAQESQYLIGPGTNLNGLYMRATSSNYTGALQDPVSFLE
jgi:hypothetical protein